MGKAKELTDQERGQILDIKKLHPTWTNQKIAEHVKRSAATIGRFLKDPESYGKAPRSGRPKVTTVRDDRRIRRLDRIRGLSSGQIKKEMNLSCSARTIRNRLAEGRDVRFSNKTLDESSESWRRERLLFASEMKSKPQSYWDNVIFTDENIWKLIGRRWFDERKIENSEDFPRQHRKGKSIMFWAGISSKGKTEIIECPVNMNSDQYQDILAKHLLPLISSGDYILINDKLAAHSCKAWLNAKQLKVLKWPARSPDLNPFEDLWGLLSNRIDAVYGDSFSSVSELRNAIVAEWSAISENQIKKYTSSMKERLILVSKIKGGLIKY